MSDDKAPSASRRRLFKSLSLVPIVAAGLGGCARAADKPADSSPAQGDYKPSFFSAAEWAFILAACDRLIPADDIGPGALQAGVPEFIDRHMQTPYASGEIWYMQGPLHRSRTAVRLSGPFAGARHSARGT
jgi:gluconate 2-dehydrogenase gamma chain